MTLLGSGFKGSGNSSGGSGAVSSVFGREGAILAQLGDYGTSTFVPQKGLVLKIVSSGVVDNPANDNGVIFINSVDGKLTYMKHNTGPITIFDNADGGMGEVESLTILGLVRRQNITVTDNSLIVDGTTLHDNIRDLDYTFRDIALDPDTEITIGVDAEETNTNINTFLNSIPLGKVTSTISAANSLYFIYQTNQLIDVDFTCSVEDALLIEDVDQIKKIACHSYIIDGVRKLSFHWIDETQEGDEAKASGDCSLQAAFFDAKTYFGVNTSKIIGDGLGLSKGGRVLFTTFNANSFTDFGTMISSENCAGGYGMHEETIGEGEDAVTTFTPKILSNDGVTPGNLKLNNIVYPDSNNVRFCRYSPDGLPPNPLSVNDEFSGPLNPNYTVIAEEGTDLNFTDFPGHLAVKLPAGVGCSVLWPFPDEVPNNSTDFIVYAKVIFIGKVEDYSTSGIMLSDTLTPASGNQIVYGYTHSSTFKEFCYKFVNFAYVDSGTSNLYEGGTVDSNLHYFYIRRIGSQYSIGKSKDGSFFSFSSHDISPGFHPNNLGIHANNDTSGEIIVIIDWIRMFADSQVPGRHLGYVL